jgi:hypothetical protein
MRAKNIKSKIYNAVAGSHQVNFKPIDVMYDMSIPS